MNKLEIFIAGSKALEEERSWVRTVASNIVAEYHRKGVVMHYAIYDYTNFDLTFDTNGQQNNYNNYIANQADLVIFILDKTIGDKTLGEFDVAYNAYNTKRRPSICIFSKKHNIYDENIDKLRAKATSLNQYYNEYETREQLERLVDKLLRDHSDRIVEKSNRRRIAKIIWSVVALAVVAIVGVAAFALNSGSKESNESAPAPAIQPVAENNVVVVAEKPVVVSAPSQTVEVEKPVVESPEPQNVAVKSSTTEPKAAQAPAKQQKAETVASTKTEAAAPKQTAQPAKPKPTLREKADAGDVASCYELALKLQSGSGVAKNLGEAFRYMKLAAEGGYSKAYRPLGEMYHQGAGVAKNRDVAAQWYQKAADEGDRKALQILNNML